MAPDGRSARRKRAGAGQGGTPDRGSLPALRRDGDGGDTVVAPKIRDLPRWTIRIGKRRPELKDTTLTAHAAKAERRLDVSIRREPRSRGGGVFADGFPVPWKEFVKAGLRRVGDAGENIGEPRLGIDVVQLGGGDQAVHDGGALSAAI